MSRSTERIVVAESLGHGVGRLEMRTVTHSDEGAAATEWETEKVEFSPDGSRVVAVRVRDRLRKKTYEVTVADVLSGDVIGRLSQDEWRYKSPLRVNTHAFVSLFAQDGATIVVNRSARSVILWSPDNGSCKRTSLRTVKLAQATSSKWKWEKGGYSWTGFLLSGDARSPPGLSPVIPGFSGASFMSFDGQFVLEGTYDGQIRFVEFQTMKTVWEKGGHDREVYGVFMTRDGQFAASVAHSELSVKLWRARDGEYLGSHCVSAPISAVALGPFGLNVAVGTMDGDVELLKCEMDGAS